MRRAELHRTARAALAAFDLDPACLGEPLSLGNNASYEVCTATGLRLVLRIHRPGYRTVANTRSEQLFLRHIRDPLKENGIAVPQPVATRSGEFVVEVGGDRGTRHCDLNTWIEGSVHVPGDGLGPRQTWRLGRALGQLHNLSQEFGRPEGIDLPDWDAAGMFTAAASPFRPLHEVEDILAADDLALFKQIAERAGEIFSRPGIATGLIHVDYILGNCLLTDDTVSVLDFDDCGYGCYLYDLCPLLGNLAGYPGAIYDNPEFPAYRREFLSGYRSVRDLPESWEQFLPVLMASRHANHTLLTAGLEVSGTFREDAAWRMQLARRCLQLT